MTVRLLAWVLVLAVGCGKAASEKPLSKARSHAASQQILYDVIDLSGDLGNGIPDRISDNGIITGTAHDSATGYFKFTYDTATGAVQRYYPPLDASRGSAIQRLLFNGDTCGYHTSKGNIMAFLQQAGVTTDLGTLGGSSSFANDCNLAGQVVGGAPVGTASNHAFFWQNGVMTDLGSFGGDGGSAVAINSQGQATGGLEAQAGYGNRTHAFFYDGNTGTLTDLGTLGTIPNNPNSVDRSFGQAINELGHIAGKTSSPNSPTGERGFLWDGQTMIDMGPNPDNDWSTEVVGMNDSDVVVGAYANYTQGSNLAYAWLNGVITDLNTVVGPTDMVLWRATAVNNNGQIVGYGGTPNSGVQRAFLLNPR